MRKYRMGMPIEQHTMPSPAKYFAVLCASESQSFSGKCSMLASTISNLRDRYIFSP